jgi:AbrB family looped-hinge helix DNA binding protein
MNTTVTIDKAGRVVIPKTVRDSLHLEAGDSLQLESDDEGVTLRLVRPPAQLKKEHGFWVLCGHEPLSLDEANKLIRDVREDRARHVLGEDS